MTFGILVLIDNNNNGIDCKSDDSCRCPYVCDELASSLDSRRPMSTFLYTDFSNQGFTFDLRNCIILKLRAFVSFVSSFSRLVDVRADSL